MALFDTYANGFVTPACLRYVADWLVGEGPSFFEGQFHGRLYKNAVTPGPLTPFSDYEEPEAHYAPLRGAAFTVKNRVKGVYAFMAVRPVLPGHLFVEFVWSTYIETVPHLFVNGWFVTHGPLDAPVVFAGGDFPGPMRLGGSFDKVEYVVSLKFFAADRGGRRTRPGAAASLTRDALTFAVVDLTTLGPGSVFPLHTRSLPYLRLVGGPFEPSDETKLSDLAPALFDGSRPAPLQWQQTSNDTNGDVVLDFRGINASSASAGHYTWTCTRAPAEPVSVYGWALYADPGRTAPHILLASGRFAVPAVVAAPGDQVEAPASLRLRAF